jgi:hypothetical protein
LGKPLHWRQGKAPRQNTPETGLAEQPFAQRPDRAAMGTRHGFLPVSAIPDAQPFARHQCDIQISRVAVEIAPRPGTFTPLKRVGRHADIRGAAEAGKLKIHGFRLQSGFEPGECHPGSTRTMALG